MLEKKSRSEKHHELLAGLMAQDLCLAYTPDIAAVVSGRSRTRIFLAIRRGELAARKDGRRTIVEASELKRWIQQLPAREVRNEAG